MNIDNHFENLIARYLNGDCSGQEVEELYSWINQHEENKEIFNQIKDTWDSVSRIDFSTEKQLTQFYKNQSERKKVFKLSYWKQAVAAAAVLAIGLLSGILFMHNNQKIDDHEVVFNVPFGSKSSVTLADGSIVILNSGSTITYKEGNQKNGRKVHLSGEAFFDVEPDKKSPFLVYTDDFTIEVTGTSFNVCAYSDNPFSSATLAEGSVSLTFNRSGQSFNLKPGERMRFDRESNRYSLLAVDVEPEVAWKDDDFIFRNMAFPELSRRLERWYDVKLTFEAPELKEFTYSGRFKNQETIWQVLDALKLTTPLDYKRVSDREFEILYKPAIR
jgi:transmembrane sensor